MASLIHLGPLTVTELVMLQGVIRKIHMKLQIEVFMGISILLVLFFY